MENMGKKAKNIIIIRLSSIGDIVLSLPFYRFIHEHDPEVNLYAVVKHEYRELLSHHKLIKKVITFKKGHTKISDIQDEIRKLEPAAVIDLQNNQRSRLFRKACKSDIIHIWNRAGLERRLFVLFRNKSIKKLGSVQQRYRDTLIKAGLIKKRPEYLKFHPKDFSGIKLNKTALKYAGSSYICIGPEAKWKTKQWPGYNELIRILLKKQKKKIILIGKNNQEEWDMLQKESKRRVVNLIGKTSLSETIDIIRRSSLFIGNDSGLMHIADLFEKPLISIWGPTVREFGFFPSGKKARVIQRTDLCCRPCSIHGTRHCPRLHFKCMKEIKPVHVAEKVLRRHAK